MITPFPIMSSNKPLVVLVTGASGFLGSHIVYQLLEAGYFVKGTARGAKAERLQKAFAKYGDRFQSVSIEDISSSDLSEALQGVNAIIHSAAALPGRADAEGILKGAIEGSLHLMRQAVRAGINRVVMTSSIVTYPSGDGPFGVNDWNPVTREQAQTNYWLAYQVSKTFADKAVIEFAGTHTNLDITFLCPPWIFGPLAPGFEEIVPEPDYKSFATDGYIYAMLNPSADDTYYSAGAGNIDVRDVARAHVLALESPPRPISELKRFALISPQPSSYADAIRLLREERPALRDRLADPDKAPSFSSMDRPVNRKLLEDVIGLKVDSYKTWRETVLDTIDSLVKMEEYWKARGFKLQMPTKPAL